MGLKKCINCNTRVIPMDDGKCPSCRETVFGKDGEPLTISKDIEQQFKAGKRKGLPTGVKAIGIIGIIYGIWNILFILFAWISGVVSNSEIFKPLVMKVFLGVDWVFALYLLIACIGMLAKKKWGHKLVLYGMFLAIILSVAYLATICIKTSFHTPGIICLIGGSAFIGTVFGMIIRYLLKPEIKGIFQKEEIE